MSVWLDRVNGTRLKKYAAADLQSEFEAVTAKGGEEGYLKASCRCRGAQFAITRSTELSGQSCPSFYKFYMPFFFSFLLTLMGTRPGNFCPREIKQQKKIHRECMRL